MFDTIAPRYDLVNRLMTFRMDVGWRRRTLAEMNLPECSTVLDLAAGTGDFCIELERAGHRAVGIDLSLGMLQNARTKSPLSQGDLLALPVASGSVDGAVCGYALRNLVDLQPFFAELQRVIRVGGSLGLLYIQPPENRILRAGFSLYFDRIVPRIGGLLSDKSAYSYLPKSVSYLPPKDVILQQLQEAGLSEVHHRQLSGGLSQLITARRA